VIAVCDASKVQPLLCSKPSAQQMIETQLSIHCDPWIQASTSIVGEVESLTLVAFLYLFKFFFRIVYISPKFYV
jgi:hypothetical protein